MSERYLITGGLGHLGQAITGQLLEKGEKIRLFDVAAPKGRRTDVEYVQGDITDASAVARACEGCQIVMHLAARVPQARLAPEAFRKVNVLGTKNAMEGAIQAGAKRLVFASTIEIYGPHTDRPVREDSKLHFAGEYSRNKWAGEEMIREAVAAKRIEAVMLRMPLILGPGKSEERGHLLLFAAIHRNLPVPLPSPPDAPYSAVAVDDAASAFLLAAHAPNANGEAMNIAAPDTPPALQLFRDFTKAAGSRSRIFSVPQFLVRPAVALAKRFDIKGLPPELLDYVFTGGAYSIEKARKVIGYAPHYTCLEALLRSYRAKYPS
ncbi:MAG: NAD-dependent epimerase/dehydratase family protein [Bdellovibrionota bacterium]